ncbi:MAG: VOC family protein [Gemmatimonadales bacterium]
MNSGIEAPGFRLPAEVRIGAVSLQVADLDRSLGFYEKVLGFRVLARDDAPGGRSVRLGAVGDDRVLLELNEKPGVRPVPRRGRLGIYHFAVLLPTRQDLGRFLRHAAALGVHVGSSDHLVSEALYLVDPDGISVEIYRDRPRGDWTYRNGEVVAAILPLDGEALVAAADGQPWRGLPRGTTIGHMHFYVGDIPPAEAFYHAALGFDKVAWSLPGMLFVSAGGYHHHVGLNTWAAGSPVATDDDARLLSWELVLPESLTAEAAAKSLRGAGYDVTAADGAFVARDPWGITVRLRS